MLRKIIMFGLIFVIMTGCSFTEASIDDNEGKEKPAKVSTEKVTNVEDKEPVELKELGTIGTKEDIYVKEEIDMSKYPKVVTEGELTYHVEYFEKEFMSNYSVYIREYPTDDSDGLGFVRPGDKAFAFEITSSGDWVHVRKGDIVGWSKLEDLVDYNGSKVAARRNNFGSPFGNTVFAHNSVFVEDKETGQTRSVAYTTYGVQTRGFDEAIKKEDSYFYIWGGNPNFDPFDGMNTHFVVDSKTLKGIETDESITITDDFGGAFHYNKVKEFEVDSLGIGLEDGIDYWNEIVSVGDKEKVVFQVTDDFETSKIIIFEWED